MSALVPANVANAQLPVVYKEAVKALERCESIDECKTWRDKAAAIASYARQVNDDALLISAQRIKDRAMRRMGQLLAEIPAPEGRPPKQENRDGTGPVLVTRSDIADRVGLSQRQTKDALRIAAIPEAKFEKAVEAEKPATVTELARMGTKPKAPPKDAHLRGRDPEDFKAATRGLGALRDFTEEVAEINPNAFVRGIEARDVKGIQTQIDRAFSWLQKLRAALQKKGG